MAATEKPLAGKRIVVTRAPEQARDLVLALERLGAEVLSLPTVCFAPAEDSKPLDAALQSISEFDWLLFTSQNAVRFFCRRCREIGVPPEGVPSPKLRVGAVGTATAQAATQEGMRLDRVAKDNTGESLADEMRGEMRARKVLLPRSDRADDRLPKALRDTGASVTDVVTYRTILPAEFDSNVLGRVRRAEVDAVIFASPSAFQNFNALLGSLDLSRLSARAQFAAIGPTTAAAIREAGFSVGIETKEPNSTAFANAIARHYQGKTATVRSL